MNLMVYSLRLEELDRETSYVHTFFALRMEALNQRLVKEANFHKSWIRIKLCPTSMIIPCLLFGDNCLLFCKTNPNSYNKIKNILDNFYSTLGQLVNYHKYALTFPRNTLPSPKQSVTIIFNIPHRESLGKYLGCPVFQGKPNNSPF